MLNFCDFIQVFVFTRNHHLNLYSEDSIFCSVNELIFSKWFCCINLDFCAFTSGLSQNQFDVYKHFLSNFEYSAALMLKINHVSKGVKIMSLCRHPCCSVKNRNPRLTAALRSTGSVDSTGNEFGITPCIFVFIVCRRSGIKLKEQKNTGKQTRGFRRK